MPISDMIYKLRSKYNLSQESFAEAVGVSRQAVQKWESGNAKPDIDNLIGIAKKFNVTLDAILLGSDIRTNEELCHISKLEPDIDSIHSWELYSETLGVEYTQSVEEGLDILEYKELFDAVSKMKRSVHKEKIADVLFDIIRKASALPDYKYNEPSDLDGIRALRKPHTFEVTHADDEVLADRIKGAWLGRICGCLLGKPIEGIRTNELIPILKASGNYPMHRYILSSDITEQMKQNTKFRLENKCYADTVSCAPSDDDTNYTVLYQLIVEKYGRDFTPKDVAKAWLRYQPKDAYCTAERVAFCNFVKGYAPPASAMYKNPYREWIGAQIRADYFGYINPGAPSLAAEMAWRDASISHVKNGIYGEMFVAAMLACAAVTDSIEDIILGGLAEIPHTSRLYEQALAILDGFKNGVSQSDCFKLIHEKYNEHSGHDWCHTVSNALIVTAALLYGGGDYSKSICMAVETGFDTDCNGATVGSIIGMRNGSAAIGKEWTAPVGGILTTEIFGMDKADIDTLVNNTLRHKI